MKNAIMLIILFVLMTACLEDKASKNELADAENITLDGFWLRSFSDYDFRDALQQMNCPDPEAMALYDPYALGTHFLIQADSISFFRYPYQYYGSSQYELLGDSLWITSNPGFVHPFSIQRNNKDSLLLNFQEAVTSSCRVSAKAIYEPFTPDAAIINKLLRDSISYDLLAGKWWYLRKEIGFNDGSEPYLLNFPKGMPDSLFISEAIIGRDVRHPFISLKLDRRMIDLSIKNPTESSFTLTPKVDTDKVLFSNFIDYGDYIDTIYRDVVYQKGWRY